MLGGCRLRQRKLNEGTLLAALVPPSRDADKDRVCHLVGIGYRVHNGCCLGLVEAGARPFGTHWLGAHCGRRDREERILEIRFQLIASGNPRTVRISMQRSRAPNTILGGALRGFSTRLTKEML